MSENSAIDILNTYYASINEHDMSKILELLDDDVHVIFPEQERNWSGKVRR
jgi:ketosteroid isomerase-like protein